MPPLVVEAFGVRVAVQPPDAATRQRWAGQWSRAVRDGSTADAEIDLRSISSDEDVDAVDYRLASRITLSALDATVATRLCLHAAGLTDAAGRAVALVAASGTGKTTAARTLGRHLGYLSDETVAVADDLTVLAHPKPLSVVLDPARPHHKRQHGPDELGLLPAVVPARLRRVVVLARGESTGPAGLVRLDTTEALTRIVPQVSYLTSFTWPLLRLARLLEDTGGPWLLRYEEIEAHAEELRALLAAPTPPGRVVVHHPGQQPVAPGPPGAWTRAPWHDAVEIEEEDAVVVLTDATAYRLDLLGATLWLALDAPHTTDELVAVAVATHGDHPEADARVAAALDVLTEAGLVRAL